MLGPECVNLGCAKAAGGHWPIAGKVAIDAVKVDPVGDPWPIQGCQAETPGLWLSATSELHQALCPAEWKSDLDQKPSAQKAKGSLV